MGTDALFENHTIKEIQEIEKKLRNDIERKKEELRQMVGERYRDLMEAADTITEMREIAKSVTTCVKSIENGCLRLQNSSLQNGITSSLQGKVLEKKKTNECLYTVASQIKILIDSPMKIWSFIQTKDFVNAVSLYLLARHTHSLLVMDPVYRDRNIPALFPIVNKQWTSINSFRHVLLQSCQLVLETQNTEPEDALGPLCCSCLLSSTSLQHTLSEVLNIRKNVLKSIFQPEKYAKEQMCEFVTVVQMTLKIIYVLLCPEIELSMEDDYKTNLLHQELVKLISKEGPGPVSLLELKSSETFKFLPTAITDFRPILSIKPEPCNVDLLQSKCNEWLNDIKTNFQQEIRNLLNFVSSVQNLTFIREIVFEKIVEIKNWDKICNVLLKKNFSIWDFFLKECFLQRIEDIIHEQLKSASESCQKDIEETLYKIGLPNEKCYYELQYEKNIAVYVWNESPCDVLENVAWNPRHHRNCWNSGELSMKAMGFTPKIQSICKELDNSLKKVLEDSAHFSYFQHHMVGEMNQRDRSQKMPLDMSKDAEVIYKYLAEGAEKHFFDLASFIETTLLYLKEEKNTPENSHRIILLGHLCNGIANLCPHINSSLSAEKLNDTVERCKRQGIKIVFNSVTSKDNELWKVLKKKLVDLSSSSFRFWSSNHIGEVFRTVDEELITYSPEGLLKSLLLWDKVEIQEESEQGNSVKSVLRVPQQVSTPVSNALFSFCCKLNTIGGYAINSDVRSSMSKELLTGLLKIYKSKINSESQHLNPRLLQVQSMQMLFDVQFLVGLTVLKDDVELSGLVSHVVDKAVSRIDPFDMDVFYTPLQQNIRRALQKSLSLFGLIASPDQVSYLNIKSHSVSSPNDPNIMLTSNTGSRFPLLPLPTKASMAVGMPQDAYTLEKEEPHLPLHHSHSSSPNLTASDMQTNTLKSAASFYERVTAMSSSWFG